MNNQQPVYADGRIVQSAGPRNQSLGVEAAPFSARLAPSASPEVDPTLIPIPSLKDVLDVHSQALATLVSIVDSMHHRLYDAGLVATQPSEVGTMLTPACVRPAVLDRIQSHTETVEDVIRRVDGLLHQGAW